MTHKENNNQNTMSDIKFRSMLINTDPDTIEEIVRSTSFFYEDEIPIARQLAEETLTHGAKAGYKFIFAEDNGRTLGYAAYGHVDGTDGTYDLYWIAVHNSARGKGIGTSILTEIIEQLIKSNARQLIAETSSLPKYEPTRCFYLNNSFVLQASLPDFFRIGDDKLFYIRRLPPIY
jgi:ribosomal protein S18 acetylase RimI-like enzyme